MIIRRVTVLGTGTMGPGIAALFALNEIRTVLYGRTSESVGSGLTRARLASANMEKFGLIGVGRTDTAEQFISGMTELDEAVEDADFIIEAVVEDLEVKKRLFYKIGRNAPSHAIITTNTSSFSVSEVMSLCERPERTAGMHWWNPPHISPLIEIVKTNLTSDATIAQIIQTAQMLDKRPVLVRKELPGLISMRLQCAMLREAIALMENDVASVEDIDLVMRMGPGLSAAVAGPLQSADYEGLDDLQTVMDNVLPDLENARKAPAAVRNNVRADHAGAKVGHGFYKYAERTFEEIMTERDARIARIVKTLRPKVGAR